MDVSVIIINYKTFELTRQCIDSVLKHTADVSFEIVLVENGTGEFNEANTQHWGGKVKLIVSQQNLGFAGGNNLGIRHAGGAYLLLLNSDTYLTENSIAIACNFLRRHEQAGVVSARLIYPDGRHQSVAQRFPSVRYALVELLRLQKLLSRKRAGRLLLGAFFQHDETVEADWVWGAFFMTRKTIIEQLPGGKLNEDYFMYWEDVQWCMDIRRLGYKICFLSTTSVVHIQEGSKGKTNKMMEQSREAFFRKNYSAVTAAAIKFLQKCLGT